MARKRNLGSASLLVVASGLVLTETAIHLEIVSGPLWRIIAAGFEAGTVGGLADWFAVSALFREVPIPVIRRHTNILVKNRARLTEGAVDLVTNRWLSPDMVKAKLADISFSRIILKMFENPARQGPVVECIRDILSRLSVNLDRPQVAEFLERFVKEQLDKTDFTLPLGNWLKEAIREGKHQGLLDTILDSAEKTLGDPEVQDQIRCRVEDSINELKERDFFKKAFLGIAEFFGVLDKEMVARKIVEKINDAIQSARGNTSYPLRKKIDALLLDFATGMASGNPAVTDAIRTLKTKLMQNADTKTLIARSLSKVRIAFIDQLSYKDSPLLSTIGDYLGQILKDLQADQHSRENIDAWMRETITALTEKYHHTIGDMIRESLHPKQLDDRGLVNQIEEKVGTDLQYIRLNGAVVGGIVGILIGIIRFLLTGR